MILSRAEGNPFFLEELALSIQDRGGLAGDLAVPDTVQGVLLSRIERLAETEQALLQSAAVIGKDVPLPILAAVTELPEEPLAQALAPPERGGVPLRGRARFPEVKYRFRHALTHEVAYESLRPERRRQLHARIVLAIEASHSDRLLEDVDRLAHHATRGRALGEGGGATRVRPASRPPRARPTCRRSRTSSRRWTPWRICPRSRATIEQAIDVRLDLRNSLHPLGRPRADPRAPAGGRSARPDARRSATARPRLLVHDAVLPADGRPRSRGRIGGARARARRPDCGTPPLWIVANTCLGPAYDARGEYRKAADVLPEERGGPARASRSARTCGSPGSSPVFCAHLPGRTASPSWASSARGRPTGTRARQLAEAADDAYSLIFASCGVGTLHLLQGDVEPAIAMLERGLTLCRTLTVPVALPLIACALGAAYCSGRALERRDRAAGGRGREKAVAMRTHGRALRCWSSGWARPTSAPAASTRPTSGPRALLMAREQERARARGLRAAPPGRGGGATDARGPGGRPSRVSDRPSALAEELSMRPLRGALPAESRPASSAGRAGPRAPRQLLDAATAAFRELEMPFWLERAEAEAGSLA